MENKMWLQRKFEIFYEISRAINASLNRQDVLDAMLERLVTELGFKGATIRILDQEQQSLELGASYGLSEAFLVKGKVELTRSSIDRSVLGGRIMALRDVRKEAGFPYSREAEREGLAGLLAAPLISNGIALGVLHLYSADEHDFTPEEQAFISDIASLGAQAIRRTHCFDAFYRIVHLINSSLELDSVLKTLLRESVRELNVRAGAIRLLNAEKKTLNLAAAYGLSDAYWKKGEVRLASSPIDRRVLRDARPVTIADVSREQGFQYADEAFREGIRSILVLPLRLKNTAIGIMRLYSGRIRRFSPDEIHMAAAVADLGAVAIENARLHQVLKQRLEALKEDVDGWYRFLSLG